LKEKGRVADRIVRNIKDLNRDSQVRLMSALFKKHYFHQPRNKEFVELREMSEAKLWMHSKIKPVLEKKAAEIMLEGTLFSLESLKNAYRASLDPKKLSAFLDGLARRKKISKAEARQLWLDDLTKISGRYSQASAQTLKIRKSLKTLSGQRRLTALNAFDSFAQILMPFSYSQMILDAMKP
jgi:hypothetical protein